MKVAILCLALAMATLSGAAGQTPDARSSDELFAEVGALVPEFGGWYLDSQRNALIVYVTAQRDGILEEIREAVQRVYPPSRLEHLLLDSMILVDGDYTWVQLKGWYDRFLKEAGSSIKGLNFADINEKANRLNFGVEDLDSQRERIERELDRLDIPRGAVQLLEVGRTMPIPGIVSPQEKQGERGGVWFALGAAGLLIVLLLGWNLRLRRAMRSRVGSDQVNRDEVSFRVES